MFGLDEPDILFITNWITNDDAIWDEPSAARYLSLFEVKALPA